MICVISLYIDEGTVFWRHARIPKNLFDSQLNNYVGLHIVYQSHHTLAILNHAKTSSILTVQNSQNLRTK